MNPLAQAISGLQDVLGICPCCGEIFRLVEGKFLFPQAQPRSCDYLELVASERGLSAGQERLQNDTARFEQKLEEHRQRLRDKGNRRAKRDLMKIDPMFSGKGIDPQDVKAIFHPVEYVIFHGLCSAQGVTLIELVSRMPTNRLQEIVLKSVNDTIKRGDVEFETLRVKEDGTFEITAA
jgi:predicted Holliday junction resolvase-like endonuclease